MNTKYVVIISTETDFSTTKVIDWIRHFQFPYIVINENTFIELEYLNINKSGVQFELNLHNKHAIIKLSNKNIHSVWYRRGNFSISYIYKKPLITYSEKVNNYFNEFATEQRIVISQFLSKHLTSTYKHLNRLEDNFINKIDVLKYANICGLNIPNSFFYQKKKYLKFDSSMINKSLSNPVYFKHNENIFCSMTELLNKERNEFIPELFPPSFFQNLIKKSYELRIFFIENKYYSMAIFSQNDEQTKIDFRNYNESKPNRFVPHSLPNYLKIKLNKLMKMLNLNSGSIDFIVGEDGNYYFLEVNPIGQYDMVSVPCNYNIHKLIAQYLTS